jgi:glycosyltransferase involved in cell wall biosynthesis
MREELGWLHDKIVISTRSHYPVYGVEYLIRAMPLILRKIKDAKLLVLGDGTLLDYHRTLARDLGIEKKVSFLGHVPNDLLPKMLNAADVYVSTSFSDGAAATLMEAIACGLPVVATRIPANEEWITPGENGFLVQPADSVALAHCVVTLLQSHDLRSAMSRANLELAKTRADWKINSLELDRCVSDLLASHPSP